MKAYSKYIGLIVGIALSMCMSDLAFAQGSPGQNFSRSSGSGSGSRSSSSRSSGSSGANSSASARSLGSAGGSGSTSRSVSFVKDGKRVAIKENSRGITVSVDGKSVRAKNMADLKKRYPDAYKFYEGNLNNPKSMTSAGGGGSSRGGGSAGGSGNGRGGPGQFSEDSTQSRNVSLTENGKKISITQNKAGITVSVNGKRVRAKNATELKKKSPEAFKMYEKHLGASNGRSHTNPPDAQTLMQEQLRKMLEQNADNPQVRKLIERMMENSAQ